MKLLLDIKNPRPPPNPMKNSGKGLCPGWEGREKSVPGEERESFSGSAAMAGSSEGLSLHSRHWECWCEFTQRAQMAYFMAQKLWQSVRFGHRLRCSGTGAPAESEWQRHGQNFSVGSLRQECRMAEAKTRCSSGSDFSPFLLAVSLTCAPSGPFLPCNINVQPLFLFPTCLRSTWLFTYGPHGYLTSLCLIFLKISVFLF